MNKHHGLRWIGEKVCTSAYYRCDIPIGTPYNAPDDPCAANIQDGAIRRLMKLRWGLILAWANEPSNGNGLINARGEILTNAGGGVIARLAGLTGIN
jgi:hypothetical protein